MSINVLVNGAFGKMGQITVKTLNDNSKFNLVGQTGREYDLGEAIKDSKAQVVIDFTHPSAVHANTLTILEAGARPVIGTSGLTRAQISALQQRCKDLKLGGLIVPNFSLGAVLMMKYAKEIARYMSNVEIIEYHHEQKADSPSGTAIRTADMLAEQVKSLNPRKNANTETIAGARGANYQNIPIHSIRLPGLLAHQQVIFGDTGETLSLRHDSIDRTCFMPGICLACEKVMTLDQLVYGLEEVL